MSNISSADFCYSAHRPRSINDQINIPFYIWAPNFRDSSGGIRVLHYLCHILNEMGEEAYLINTEIESPRLRTPLLTYQKLKEHFIAGKNPVTIYPEIISTNPANTSLIARWLLNVPGHLGNHIEFEPKDLIFYYEAWCVPDGLSGTPLFIHPVDHNFFNNNNNPDDNNRTEECYYANKYLIGKKPILDEHKGLTSLGQEIKRTHKEIAAILRKSKVLYCYEPSGIISEAQACGCPVIFVRSDYWPLPPNDTHHKIPGAAIYGEENALERALETLPLIPEVHANARDNSWQMTKTLVEFSYSALNDLVSNGKPCKNEIQELWLLPASERKDKLNEFTEFYFSADIYFKDLASTFRSKSSYKKWLDQRSFIETDTKFLFEATSSLPSPIKFHLIIRLPAGSTSLLADTLDSLNQQINADYHLDIFTTLTSPEGFDQIPTVDWHTLDSELETKEAIDFIIQARKFDWVIELPPGARLDILYLWRLSYEIQLSPEATAFFVDDDSCDESGKRFDPRFKPGVNIETLRSMDLAGPLCVRTTSWQLSGGASQRNGSPWFEKLLQITDQSGWGGIKHISDILITYLHHLPTDFESCLIALMDSLNARGMEGQIGGITDQSWGVRYSLKNPPAVTVAITSSGQLELIKRNLESALKSTSYPNYEILIVTNKVDGDPDFDNWLTNIQNLSKTPKIRVVYSSADANYAARCNTAIASVENELVVLTREETVFVQDSWLEELVSTLQQADIAAAAPLIHQPGDAKILFSGQTLGLLGEYGSPHAGKASLGDAGYLDCLQVSKDTVALSSACFLVRKTVYKATGGMDETQLGDDFADIDLCIKLHRNQHRIVVHPRASVVYGFDSSQFDLKQRAEANVKRFDARAVLRQRWGSDAVVDPYWNTNLSICDALPKPEVDYRALWQFLPTTTVPKILAHPIGNGQGDFRVTNPLNAIRKAGLASPCIWRQSIEGQERYLTAAEICRLQPTSVIIQNYIHDISLAVLDDWSSLKNRPFLIYTLDDLINDLDKTNPFRKHIPPNARSRFKYALKHCDRLVLSTDFLADTYRHFIDDIKVVPNRLEKDIWLPLSSQRRTSQKPRIGWAGGSTHEGDLILLKEIIEQTRDEADWVFFGMCPDSIRPLLAEFHELVSFDAYPSYLASLNLDIAVAPLAMTPFNQGKSNLRLLEYGALGIPVVCTDIDPYWNSPACRVKNTPSEWVAALRERIYDADAREAEGNAMQSWMYQSYLLEDHLDDWLNAHLPG